MPTTLVWFKHDLRLADHPAPVRIPGGVVHSMLGEAADEMLLQSARVLPEKLQDTATRFALQT